MATHHTAMVVTLTLRAPSVWLATCDALRGWEHDVTAPTEAVAIWIGAAAAHEERARRLRSMADAAIPRDQTRCAVCGWPMGERPVDCKPRDCSMRPRPERLYDPARAEAERTASREG